MRRPRRLRLQSGLVGRRLPDAVMRPGVRQSRRMRRAGHVRVQVRLVRRELHDARLRDDVRQRRQLHGARYLYLSFPMEWRGLQSPGM